MSAPATPKKPTRISPYFPPSVASRYFKSPDLHLTPTQPDSPRTRKRTIAALLAEVDCDPGKNAVYGSAQTAPPDLDFERSLVYNSAFLCFGNAFIETYDELWRSKPILIQEHISRDPWKLLVVTMFLNKTAGKYAIPVFWEVMKKWPTPEALSLANQTELTELIKPLGLQYQRAKRLIQLSIAYIDDPPSSNNLRKSKSYQSSPRSLRKSYLAADSPASGISAASGALYTLAAARYPPTPVSHLPGAGPYALDSYRIFCADDDEWKNVRPSDKELIRYLKWKWAVTSFDLWEPDRGVLRKITLPEMQSLIEELSAFRGCHSLHDI